MAGKPGRQPVYVLTGDSEENDTAFAIAVPAAQPWFSFGVKPTLYRLRTGGQPAF